MGQIFDKTHYKRNNWMWDNLCAFGDPVNHSNVMATTLGKVKCTSEHFACYCSDDLRAKIEPPSCRQYKPGNFLAIRPWNWDEIIDKVNDNENWAVPTVPRGEWSCASDGNGNGNGNGEGAEYTQAGEKGTGNGNGSTDGKGNEKRMSTEKRKGKGKRKGERTGIVIQTPGGDDIS
jgi:hypothetical protein